MKIALFGASGATGRLLTERCLAAGHTVSALVRTPENYPFADRVRVVKGDAFDPVAIRWTLTGADAVLSALGARSLRREDVLERAVPLIVAGMIEQGISRIVALGSAGALDSALDKQPAYRRWIVQHIVYNTFLKWPVASQVAQYKELAASPLDWTMVMPPMLMNTAGRGRYRIDGDALPRGGSRIAREDVADFMMDQLGTEQWSRRGAYISW
ncbi:Putative NADH-flavin reductase [Granulicella rosea]|uniref:Putative NADH-flavin reductase n=1 Tax=Granulicella rosea TaxID=474952 RepID=A0A239DRE9_9BACT|nr:NAD(P)H-binding protein [Granulicella rosea]SNS34779.1 Putative NADH-flavin reductase [Granulicella rosea]